jgi:RNA polymerase sigma-70 factor (ECF subfamily)
MDRRVEARFDASDVVQDALLIAFQRFEEYVRTRPCEFFAWLQKIAFDRLNDLYRQHLGAEARSVLREERTARAFADDSTELPVERVADPRPEPAEELERSEMLSTIQQGLGRLKQADRELILARYAQKTPMSEIAVRLGITESAVKSRLVRALRRMGKVVESRSDVA